VTLPEPVRAARAVPSPTGLDAELYALAAGGTLHVQRCASCGTWRHPPRFLCAACGSPDWRWEPVSGRGRVFSWTVTHQALDPAFADAVPYAVLVVELDEGVRLVGNLVGAPPDVLRLDLPVVVDLDRRSESVALVDFRPEDAATPCPDR
jgi:uncharacterized OB-fold protein